MWPLSKGGKQVETRTPKKGGKFFGGKQSSDPTVAAIERLARDREKRRRSADNYKKARDAEARHNEAMGRPGDVDFQRMIKDFRKKHARDDTTHAKPGKAKISICVRKRPVNAKEVARKDWDSVTCLNPKAFVHTCKLKVDGITKYLDNQVFALDHTFGEDDDNGDVYTYTVQPLVAYIFRGGRGTCFAYGQTGSGKTFTMSGIEQMAARDVFRAMESPEVREMGLQCQVSFFEIYGGRCLDLLHGRTKVHIREDGAGSVQCVGLKSDVADSMDGLLDILKRGNKARTTHATATNAVSSRSHAICEITLVNRKGGVHGKLSMIDLAGSERAVDTKSHNRQRRLEGAEINKSLLALKECIRALDSGNRHVPYRASKLTLVLKDSFTNRKARVCMIATVSPCASNADHTGNTLRYADRIKQKDARSARAGNGAAATLGFGIGVDSDGESEDESPVAPAPPMSPTAQKLAEASRAARQGKITPEEKAMIKDRILRNAESAAGASSPEGAGRDKWVDARRGGKRGGAAGAGSERPSVDPYGYDSEGSDGGAGAGGRGDARDSNPLGSPIASSKPQVERLLRRVPSTRDSSGSRASRSSVGSDASAPRAAAPPAAPAPSAMSRASSEASVLGRGAKHAGGSNRRRDPPAPRVTRSTSDGGKKVESDDELMPVEEGKDPAGNWFGLGGQRGGAKPRSWRDRPSVLQRGKRLGELVPPKGLGLEVHDEDDEDEGSSGDDAGRGGSAAAADDDEAEFVAERRRADADLQLLHRTLRERGEVDNGADHNGTSAELLDFHEAVSMIVEEEERLLNSHMAAIQEHAELLTEEGQLLTKVQGEDVVDYDIDAYAARLDEILTRKMAICKDLKKQLGVFRTHLAAEEQASKKVKNVPAY